MRTRSANNKNTNHVEAGDGTVGLTEVTAVEELCCHIVDDVWSEFIKHTRRMAMWLKAANATWRMRNKYKRTQAMPGKWGSAAKRKLRKTFKFNMKDLQKLYV